jgi:hypothetical protein
MPTGSSGSCLPAIPMAPPRGELLRSSSGRTPLGTPSDAWPLGMGPPDGIWEPPGVIGVPSAVVNPGVGVREPAGVGSNATQPTPPKYSSGQACPSCVLTTYDPSFCFSPAVKPTATLAGMPRSRASTAIVEAKWTQ